MTDPRPRAWHIALIALFGAFELVVIWLALNPKVADDYRAYYIDRTSSCFPRDDSVANGAYEVGMPISFVPDRWGHTRDNLRWCGFIASSGQGIRTFGDYGIVRLRFAPPAEDLLVTFTGFANANTKDPAREVTVVANGTPIGSVSFADGRRVTGELVVPARVAAANPDGGLDLRFEVPRIAPPGTNSEPVTLQLRLQALRVSAVSDALPPATTALASRPNLTPKK
jgi:hypothetical protein